MHQPPMEPAVPMERTGHQVAENQALATAGAGSRTPEPDQRQEEGHHTQEGAEPPRSLEAVGQQIAEHPAKLELEFYRHATPAACTRCEH